MVSQLTLGLTETAASFSQSFSPKLLRRDCERCYGYLFLDALHTIYKLQLKSRHHIQTSQEASWVKTPKNALEIYLPLFSVQCWIWSLLIIPSSLSLVALDLHRRRKSSKTTTKAWEKNSFVPLWHCRCVGHPFILGLCTCWRQNDWGLCSQNDFQKSKVRVSSLNSSFCWYHCVRKIGHFF